MSDCMEGDKVLTVLAYGKTTGSHEGFRKVNQSWTSLCGVLLPHDA